MDGFLVWASLALLALVSTVLRAGENKKANAVLACLELSIGSEV